MDEKTTASDGEKNLDECAKLIINAHSADDPVPVSDGDLELQVRRQGQRIRQLEALVHQLASTSGREAPSESAVNGQNKGLLERIKTGRSYDQEETAPPVKDGDDEDVAALANLVVAMSNHNLLRRDEKTKMGMLVAYWMETSFTRLTTMTMKVNRSSDENGHCLDFWMAVAAIHFAHMGVSMRAVQTFAKRAAHLALLHDEDGEKDETSLTGDVYSLMYIAPIQSSTFVFSVLVVAFQVFMMALIMLDLVRPGTANPLQIPPSVPPQVAAAQASCMLIAAAIQQDLIQSVTFLHSGHDESLRKTHPAATRCKFYFSTRIHVSAAMLQLDNIFLPTMASDTVVSVFLNFAGLEFICMLDDLGFVFALQGFVTKSAQEMCEAAQEVKQRRTQEPSLPSRPLLCLLFRASVWLYLHLSGSSERGILMYFSQDTIWGRVFDTSTVAFLESTSGRDYTSTRASSTLKKVALIGRMLKSMLAYCENMEVNAWTHSKWDESKGEVPDPCRYGAKSAGSTIVQSLGSLQDAKCCNLSAYCVLSFLR